MSATLSEQDRLDAVENIALAAVEYAREVAVIAALDAHRLDYEGSRNLGYYRTFIECSCGAGWWFGDHAGDPRADDRWAIHRAEVLRATLESMRASDDAVPGGAS